MQLTAIDLALWMASIAGELALACVLFDRKEYRRFPIFLLSIVVISLEEPLEFWFSHSHSTGVYARASSISAVLDYMLQLGVLTEIGHAVLSPGRKRMSGRQLGWLCSTILAVAAAAAILILRQPVGGENFEVFFNHIQTVNFVFAFLRLSVFALIAGFSQMLGITWKNHVLRLAGGLAFYSAVSVITQILLSQLAKSNITTYNTSYYVLYRIQVISYLGALSFWVWSFLQKDAPRREFTPQMERFLVTISQSVKRHRIDLSGGMGQKP